jgi:hypothetical protein
MNESVLSHNLFPDSYSVIRADKEYITCNSRSRWPRGLRRRSLPLGCWDSGFQSRCGHGCLSLCIYVVLSCVGRGLCEKLATRPKELATCLVRLRNPHTGVG